jgi:hypothetical protein
MSKQNPSEIAEEIRAMLSAGRILKWAVLRRAAAMMDAERGKTLAEAVEYTRHDRIKREMEVGALRCDLGSGNSTGAPDKHTRIDILDLWAISHSAVPVSWWKWARQLCRRWSDCLGQTFVELAAVGPVTLLNPVRMTFPTVELEDLLSGNLMGAPIALPVEIPDDGEGSPETSDATAAANDPGLDADRLPKREQNDREKQAREREWRDEALDILREPGELPSERPNLKRGGKWIAFQIKKRRQSRYAIDTIRKALGKLGDLRALAVDNKLKATRVE